MLTLELAGYGLFAVLSAILAALLYTGQGSGEKRLFRHAVIAGSLWATLTAWQIWQGGTSLAIQVAEIVRNIAWFALLAQLINAVRPQPSSWPPMLRGVLRGLYTIAAALIAGLLYAYLGGTHYGLIDTQLILTGYGLLATGGLVLTEQLFRNTPPDARASVKYLCLATGGLFGYDFLLYTEALLNERINLSLWEARGYVSTLTIPVLGLALGGRSSVLTGDNTLDIHVSRKVVFHTTTLTVAALYLFAIGAGGYYVKLSSGTWGEVAQIVFLAAAIFAFLLVITSSRIRAIIKVTISKHFFNYKYDYREEWLRFVRTLSLSEPEQKLPERVVRALARIVDSPGGMLWLFRNGDRYEPVARWNLDDLTPSELFSSDALLTFMEKQEWVVDADGYLAEQKLYRALHVPALPDALAHIRGLWLIVPLLLHERMVGFVILKRSTFSGIRRDVNWEDRDLLRTAGSEAAGHLAQMESARQLSDARQFEAFNRLSTYVVHDLKNLASQLSLILTNAARHKQNPAFIDDMIGTVENSVGRMHRLLGHLRGDGAKPPPTAGINLGQVAAEVVRAHTHTQPLPRLDYSGESLTVTADRDRLAAIIGHIIENARDATPASGEVVVHVRGNGRFALVAVTDNGCGMDEAFIRERLFRPFDSTKEGEGMGIGAYETREYARSLGGDIQVESRVNQGTTFTILLPYREAFDQGASRTGT